MADEIPDLANEPRALRVIKKPIPVAVTFATDAGVCETMEGAVGYRAGDALLTGNHGDRWPVRRDLFMSSYGPVPPAAAGQDGAYIKRPAIAYALRLERALDVPVSWQNDPLHGQRGDWLLHYADGSHGVLQDFIFRDTYDPAPGEGRWPPKPSGELP